MTPNAPLSKMGRHTARLLELVQARPAVWATGIALILTFPTLFQPFLFDDHFHLSVCQAVTGVEGPRSDYLRSVRDAFGLVSLFEFFDGTPENYHAALTSGAAPWWTLEGLRISFWRPLTSYLELSDYLLFGENPLPYHVHSVAWYLAMILAWWWVLRRTLPRSTAVIALFLFAMDEAHHLPVDWIANRHALVSGTFGLLGLWAYLRWCDGWRPGVLLSMLFFGLALLAGESALGVMAYAGTHALFFPGAESPEEDKAGWSSRLVHALPVLLLAATWAGMYTVKGFGAWGSGSYLDPVSAPGEYLAAALPRLTVLIGNQLGAPAADLWTFVPAIRPLLIALGLLGICGVGVWLRIAWKGLEPAERASLRWMIPGSLLALLPAVAVTPASRLLLIPSLGGSVLLAVLIRSGLRAWPRRKELTGWSRVPPIAAIALAITHLAAPPISWFASTSALTRIARQGTALAKETAGLLAREGAGSKHVIVLNAPDAEVGIYLPLELYRMEPSFASSWQVISMAPFDLLLTRPDPGTLEIVLQGGELLTTMGETMGRSPRFPLKPGEKVALGVFDIEVLETGARGPTRIALRCEHALEDVSLLMLAWQGKALQVVKPPKVGETTTVAWFPGPLEM